MHKDSHLCINTQKFPPSYHHRGFTIFLNTKPFSSPLISVCLPYYALPSYCIKLPPYMGGTNLPWALPRRTPCPPHYPCDWSSPSQQTHPSCFWIFFFAEHLLFWPSRIRTQRLLPTLPANTNTRKKNPIKL